MNCPDDYRIFRVAKRLAAGSEVKSVNLHTAGCRKCFNKAVSYYSPGFLRDRLDRKLALIAATSVVIQTLCSRNSKSSPLREELRVKKSENREIHTARIKIQKGLSIIFQVNPDRLIITNVEFLRYKLGDFLNVQIFRENEEINGITEYDGNEGLKLEILVFYIDLTNELQQGILNLKTTFDNEFNTLAIFIEPLKSSV